METNQQSADQANPAHLGNQSQKEQEKIFISVAESITKISGDAWKIADSQWRSANAYVELVKGVGVVGGSAIAIIIGFVGFIGFSNFGEFRKETREDMLRYQERFRAEVPVIVAKEISSFFSTNKDLLSESRDKLKETEKALSKLNEFNSKFSNDISIYTSAVESVKDPEGDIRRIRQSDINKAKSDKAASIRIKQILQKLVENEKDIDIDDIFNATNLAKQLGYSVVGLRLAEIAYNRWAIPIHEARLMRFKINQGGAESDKSFARLLELVATTPTSNCELIVSDGWNGAEARRDYQALLEALEKRRSSLDYTPSFVHAIAAQAAIREGRPNWREKAEAYLIDAKKNFSSESPKSTWYEGSKGEIEKAEKWMKGEDEADDEIDGISLDSIKSLLDELGKPGKERDNSVKKF